jgi:hypothetical protein
LSLPLLIEQIAKLDAKLLELRERERHAAGDGSREFFRMQVEHLDSLKANLEKMRDALEGIDARAREISRDKRYRSRQSITTMRSSVSPTT